jgi:hypothetical protein
MSLSEGDRATIHRLRNQERLWKRNRWFVLASGAMEIGVAVWVFFWARGNAVMWGGKLDQYTPVSMFMLAVLGTKIEALFILGVFTLANVWRKWKGDPKRVLLLSLAGKLLPTGEGSHGVGGV